MFSLEDYTDQELLNILKCNKLHELYECIPEKNADQLIKDIQVLPHLQPIPNKMTQALLVPITDTSSYPFILIGSIIGFISGGTIPLMISVATILFTSLSIGAFFFYTNFKEMKKKEGKVNRLLHLYDLKEQAADLYLKRQQLEINIIDTPRYTEKHRLALFKTAVRSCMVISTTLFGTYFLGLNAVFSALGFSLVNAALGPIGVVIGLGIALAIGIYFGYRHYQVLKQADQSIFEQKCRQILVSKKTQICQALNMRNAPEPISEEVQKTKPVYSKRTPESHNTFAYKLNKLTLFSQPESQTEPLELDVSPPSPSSPC